jgi:uncharacterized C2H2 Zn-finger protein
MRIHLNLKPCKCDLCGAAFRTVKTVIEHKGISHVPSGAYKCSHCTCQFESQRGLSNHMRSQHPLHFVQRRMR